MSTSEARDLVKQRLPLEGIVADAVTSRGIGRNEIVLGVVVSHEARSTHQNVPSIGFPMTRQPRVEVVIFSEPELDRVQANRARKVNPLPEVSAAAALTAPPFPAAAHCLRCRSEMLHKQARVDRDKYRRSKVTEESQ